MADVYFIITKAIIMKEILRGINLVRTLPFYLYRVSQKERNGRFSVPCERKFSNCLTSLDKAFSAEENDIKIIKFGYVILNLCPLLEIQSFSNFA